MKVASFEERQTKQNQKKKPLNRDKTESKQGTEQSFEVQHAERPIQYDQTETKNNSEYGEVLSTP